MLHTFHALATLFVAGLIFWGGFITGVFCVARDHAREERFWAELRRRHGSMADPSVPVEHAVRVWSAPYDQDLEASA